MRINEFKVDERQKLKEMYPHLTEEQLDEILPAVLAGARTVGMAAFKGAKMAGQGLRTAGNIARKGVNAVKTGANVVKKGVNVAKQGVNAVKNTVQMGKDAINQLKGGGAQGGIDNGQAVDDVAMHDPKVMQQQKKTLQAQLKAQQKSHKDTTLQLKQQIASIK